MTASRARWVVELHCHTVYSPDGLITFGGLVHTAQRRGIDAVCITDHDTIDGALEFQRRTRAVGCPVQVIVGEERTLEDQSHLIGLFLREPIASTRLEDAVREIHAQGGVVLVPHPFRHSDGLLRGRQLPATVPEEGIDAWEIFNAKGSYADNARARGLVEMSAGVFGGSDAHYESDVGQCVCELTRCGNVEESLRAMLKRQVSFTIRGVVKRPGEGERRYAPFYYKVRPYVRVPRPLLPAAKQAYRLYRNHIRQRSEPVLQDLFTHE